MSSSPTETLVDVTMPQMGVSVAEGTVVAWRVEPGDRVEAEATICEISTDKIDTEVPAPASGVVTEILVPIGETVDVGTVMARIATGAGGASPAQPLNGGTSGAPATEPSQPLDGGHGGPSVTETKSSSPAPSARNGDRRYSPVVQRIAAEHGIDLSQVPGTGRGGRVRKQDVMTFVESGPVEEPPLHIESPYRPDPVAPPAPAVAPAVGGGELSRMRRQIGEHMKRSLDTAATCTTWIEVDMSRVEAARARLGVTALAFVSRACIDAIREHPAINAWLEGDRYTQHTDVNLGIAVSLGDDGLIVPVIPRAQELSVEGLAARVQGHREAGAGPPADPGRCPRRHVHDHEPRPVRIDHGHADHQPAAGRDPRPGGRGEASGSGYGRRWK